MKRVLKRLLLGAETIPQWATVGLHAPQRHIQVWLDGLPESRAPLDLTRNATIAAMRPFTIATCISKHISEQQLAQSSLSLVMRENLTDGRVLGRIYLTYNRSLDIASGTQIALFEAKGHRNYCLSPLQLQLHYLLAQRARRHTARTNAYNFDMAPPDLHSMFVFYICPRPVVLVTTAWNGASNVFPMDLIGPTDSPYFLLALRRTSPAVQLMQRSRHIAFGDVPADYKDIAYDLGRHHKSESIDLSQLPFETVLSPMWSLPVAKASLGVTEVEVEQSVSVGSHELFITRIVHEQRWQDGPQLFHISGLYQHYLAQRQRALV